MSEKVYAPIPERMQILRALSVEYGEPDAIPEEELSRIDYARVHEEDGTSRLAPVELLAKQAVEHTTKKEDTPFQPFTVALETAKAVRSRVSTLDFDRKVEDTVEDLYDTEEASQWFERFSGAIFTSAPLKSEYLVKDQNGELRAIYPYRPNIEYADYIDRALIKITAVNDNRSFADTLLFDTDFGDDPDMLNQQTVETVLGRLDQLEATLTDVPELTAQCSDFFSRGLIEPTWEREDGGTQLDDEHVYDSSEGSVDIFALRRSKIADQLQGLGFTTVAEAFRDQTSTADMLKLVTQSLRDNEVQRIFKQEQKALKAAYADIVAEHGVFEFNRQYQALKAQHKVAMQPLHELHDFLNLPQLFAQAARSRIKSIRDFLTVNTDSASEEVTLNPTHDRERDRDPGVVSGDCTAGNPLPFGQEPGLHNVKLELDGQHKGNIYLYETQYKGERVWHLDAIQLPDYRIVWSSAAAQLTEALAAQAAAADVDMITINNVSWGISNYDYIAKGFMDYLGARNTDVRYDELEIPAANLAPTLSNTTEQISLALPRFKSGNQLQGHSYGQIVLWRLAKSA